MRFLAPSGFWLLLALPAILALYFLKLRREKLKIPSTWLWEKTLSDLRAEKPFQRLRASLPLILQLLAATLLAAAAARPVLLSTQRTGSTLVLVLDASASMKTSVGGATRFARGRDLLLSHLAAGQSGDRAALILAGRRPAIASPLTEDLDAVERALERARPTDETADVRGALKLAMAIASRSPASHVVVATDDGPSVAEFLAGAKGRLVTVHALEAPAENAGVVTLESRPAGPVREVFTAVANLGDKRRGTRLELDLNGTLLEMKTLDLAPGERQGLAVSLPPSAQGTLRARIYGADALAADDEAWLVLRPASPIRVLLVTEGNLFLRKAWALERRVKLDVLTPAGYAASSAERYDIVAFDRWTPPRLPKGNLLLLGAPAPELGFTLGQASTEAVRVSEQDSRHPLLAHADLREVAVAKLLAADVEPWVGVLARAEGAPVLLAAERDGRRYAATTFSLLDSDWPLRLSFPIFLANATVWLGQPRAEAGAGSTRPGTPLDFDPRWARAARPVEVVDPDGATRVLAPGADAFVDTGLVGLYRIRFGAYEETRAVSLLSEAESRLWDPARAPASRGAPPARLRTYRPTLGLWRTIAALCLLVLMLELAVTLRRGAAA